MSSPEEMEQEILDAVGKEGSPTDVHIMKNIIKLARAVDRLEARLDHLETWAAK